MGLIYIKKKKASETIIQIPDFPSLAKARKWCKPIVCSANTLLIHGFYHPMRKRTALRTATDFPAFNQSYRTGNGDWLVVTANKTFRHCYA